MIPACIFIEPKTYTMVCYMTVHQTLYDCFIILEREVVRPNRKQRQYFARLYIGVSWILLKSLLKVTLKVPRVIVQLITRGSWLVIVLRWGRIVHIDRGFRRCWSVYYSIFIWNDYFIGYNYLIQVYKLSFLRLKLSKSHVVIFHIFIKKILSSFEVCEYNSSELFYLWTENWNRIHTNTNWVES